MKYYLIAGEPSGDALGARLMEALKQRDDQAQFLGIGGDNMQQHGLHSLFDISELAVMGLAEVIPSIPRILHRINKTVADIVQQKPDVIITIDSWSFCARIHKKIRNLQLGILQVHYVAPQVWAWKKRRARTMYKYIDLLLTLFPQEPQYFTPYHLQTVFVGHPVIESSIVQDKQTVDFKQRHDIADNKKIVLILPGSRHNEVARLLPDFLQAAEQIYARHNDVCFVLPTVSTVAQRVKKMLQNASVPILVVEGESERHNAFQAAAAAMAASGTVALELAIVKVPHIIAYKVPKLTEIIARLCLHIRFVNLTNILLNREVVPELLQQDCTPQNIVTNLEHFWQKDALYTKQMQGFDEVRRLLGYGEQTPSANAAQVILQFMNKSK